jgi:hypothetical protein
VLVDFLRANADVFAWSPSDMPDIPRDVAEHSLDIRAGAQPVNTRGLHAPLARAARHRQSSEARNVQADQQSRRGLRQRLEHPTATSLLPLRCFQVVRIPRSHASLSRQGRVSLASAEPDPPSGAKKGEPLCVKIGEPLCVQNFQSKRLLRSPGYVGSRTPRSERGCM